MSINMSSKRFGNLIGSLIAVYSLIKCENDIEKSLDYALDYLKLVPGGEEAEDPVYQLAMFRKILNDLQESINSYYDLNSH